METCAGGAVRRAGHCRTARRGQTLSALGQAIEFVKDQYRHCKTILVLGAESALVERAMLPANLPDGATIRAS